MNAEIIIFEQIFTRTSPGVPFLDSMGGDSIVQEPMFSKCSTSRFSAWFSPRCICLTSGTFQLQRLLQFKQLSMYGYWRHRVYTLIFNRLKRLTLLKLCLKLCQIVLITQTYSTHTYKNVKYNVALLTWNFR